MIKLYWGRFANPARRLSVTLRYQGSQAVMDLFRQRLRDHSARSVAGVKAATPPSLAHFEKVAAQAITLPAEPLPLAPGTPAISVIVRTADRPGLLALALASLANQTYRDFEVVLVNDGAADISAVVQKLGPYLRLHEVGGGPGRGKNAALNAGLEAATGRWVTYLDDDDIAYPNHLEVLANAMRDSAAEAVYSDANRALCWSDLEHDEVVLRLACASLDFDAVRLVVDNWIPNMALMHTAACVSVVGPYDAGLRLFGDWDFLIRLGRVYPLQHAAATTCEYRYRFGPMPEGVRSGLRKRQQVLDTMRFFYDRYPVPRGELTARRQLTLAALRQDVEEVRWIEEQVADPLQRDLLIAARVGRFPVSQALYRRFGARKSCAIIWPDTP